MSDQTKIFLNFAAEQFSILLGLARRVTDEMIAAEKNLFLSDVSLLQSKLPSCSLS